jgi:hypothetical protein
MIEEAALQATLRAALSPRGHHMVLVHDAAPRAGADRVAAGLARSLSWAGHATVLLRSQGDDGDLDDAADVPIAHVRDPGDINLRDYHYAIAATPMAGAFGDVRLVAPHADAAVLVARLGRTSAEQAASARRLIDALGVHVLGLVVTCSAAEASGIHRGAFGAALRPPGRSRTSSHNGDRGQPAELTAGLGITQ